LKENWTVRGASRRTGKIIVAFLIKGNTDDARMWNLKEENRAKGEAVGGGEMYE
jgi:hypothetical protein